MKYLLLFLFISLETLSAFPINLASDWFYTEGITNDACTKTAPWQEVKKYPIFSTHLDLRSESPIASFTACRMINLKEEDIKYMKDNLSIFLPLTINVHKVFFNGVLLSERGKIESEEITRNGFFPNSVVVIPEHILKSGDNELKIQVSGERDDLLAIHAGDNFVIDYHTNNVYRHSERIDLMLLFLYAFVGIYHLVLFAKRPKEKDNFYYAMLCMTISFYNYTRSNSIQELNIDPMIITRIELPVMFFATFFYIGFVDIFIKEKLSWFSKSYLGFVTILSILMIFLSRPHTNLLLKIWQFLLPVLLVYSVYLMIYGVIKGNSDSKRVVVGFLIVIVTVSFDLIGAMKLIHGFENLGFTKYGFFTFVFGVAIVLANKFLRVHNEVEELNESLERKVERRTEQLQNSLNDIRELKYQQDGDYFLTTLLIKPLMENKGFGENVNIEFYVKQKKTFEFKKKIYEIGGDICIANKIRLKDKEYTVFINGDAMGKSIQGAGGALVLGVVFRAVVSRTQMGIQRESMPEIWLKHCFMELQNVFVSFDGTMLISIVMGLIEDEKGMLYFINAEHPWSVLYRDGKASFIENQLYIRKIGMLGMEGQVKIQTFQLQSGDSIIIGSDGRDDILISVNEDGHRIINEDEANFLRCVEKGNGSLPEITKEILKLGEFTDDFTLLKASYTSQKSVLEDENFESEVYENLVKLSESNYETDAHKFLEYACKAIEMNPENTDLFKKVIKIFHNLKDYQNTIVYLEKYHQIRPDDTEQMVSLSYHYKLVGKLKLSVDYGESIRLREPKLVRNLVNLADVYRLQDLIPRANKILNEALNIDSTNKKALELLNYMEKKMHKGSHEETRQ